MNKKMQKIAVLIEFIAVWVLAPLCRAGDSPVWTNCKGLVNIG